MKGLRALILVCLAVLHATTTAQPQDVEVFPADFGEKALVHLKSLAELGPRTAGSQEEQAAASYIKNEFGASGLEVVVEPFDFEIFVVEQATLRLCDAQAAPKVIGFNPYEGPLTIGSEPVFVPPDIASDGVARFQMKDRLVITADPAPFFTLMTGKPRAIVYVDTSAYEALASKPCSQAELRVAGHLEKRSSANVVAAIGSKDRHAGEIIVSAHYDSYKGSPGADDNASGVGVLLELARHFAARGVPAGVRVKFVAFGAEELGVVGSRAYLDAHEREFARCLLLLNLDQVGGPKGPYVEMTGGISGIPETPGENRFPSTLRGRAWEGTDGRWRLVDARVVERFAVSNRPAALKDLITECAERIGREVIPTGNMGGDQQVFTQAGVVATSIGTSGNRYHGPEDTVDQIVVEQLATVGRLAAEIAHATMEKFVQGQGGR